MYLYFEDYSHFLGYLDDRNMPHGNAIIKVLASPVNPQIINSDVTVLEARDDIFAHGEHYKYGDRGTYTGWDIERQLTDFGISSQGKRIARALFRFANAEETQFTQSAMRLTRDDDWLINHPLLDIDGINPKKYRPDRDFSLHLDIFLEGSLERLRKIVDYQQPQVLLGLQEGLEFRKSLTKSHLEMRRSLVER